MELLLCSGLCDYLISADFFSHQQRGSRRDNSRITNLLTVKDRWATILDRKEKVYITCLDYLKDFYRVNHRCLIIKIKRVGIKWPLIGWLTLYPNSRLFMASVNFTFSQASWVHPEFSTMTSSFINLRRRPFSAGIVWFITFADNGEFWREI